MSCPKKGLHKSVKLWKDIQKNLHQNGNQNIVKNLKGLFAHYFLLTIVGTVCKTALTVVVYRSDRE